MTDLADLYPGFASHWIDTEAGRIFARSGGAGPPLVLLHGFPQTNVCFHRVAPRLAERFSLVAMDLRGYGWSSAPKGDGGRDTYTKRAMGRDVVAVMETLGHVRFRLAGHDRGARVGYRLALDHPGRIEKLVLLDIIPTLTMWQRITQGLQPAGHWDFLARPAPEPENDILRDPVAYFDKLLTQWSKDGKPVFDPRALAHYRASCNEPSRIHAFCEDYRAGKTTDRAQDEADIEAGKRIDCPVQGIWSSAYLGARGMSPLEVWRSTFAPHAVGTAVESGHFVAEEAPDATLAAMLQFL
jgi:haloacetate dehalogenase